MNKSSNLVALLFICMFMSVESTIINLQNSEDFNYFNADIQPSAARLGPNSDYCYYDKKIAGWAVKKG